MEMEFYETIGRRRSVRAFEERDVDDKVLDRILNAVISCPTAGNLQAYRVLVVRDNRTKAALADAAWGQSFVRDCSVVLVFSAYPEASAGKYGERGSDLYSVQDATIAATFAHLATASEGLGSCWVGAFDTKAVIKAAGLPNGLKPVALLPIGHPRKLPGRTSRLPKDELVTHRK